MYVVAGSFLSIAADRQQIEAPRIVCAWAAVDVGMAPWVVDDWFSGIRSLPILHAWWGRREGRQTLGVGGIAPGIDLVRVKCCAQCRNFGVGGRSGMIGIAAPAHRQRNRRDDREQRGREDAPDKPPRKQPSPRFRRNGIRQRNWLNPRRVRLMRHECVVPPAVRFPPLSCRRERVL
jgi:hypothetical protein